MTATIATAARYTVRPAGEGTGWEVVAADGTVATVTASRAQARTAKKELEANPVPEQVQVVEHVDTDPAEIIDGDAPDAPESETEEWEYDAPEGTPADDEALDTHEQMERSLAIAREAELAAENEGWGIPPVPPMVAADDTPADEPAVLPAPIAELLGGSTFAEIAQANGQGELVEQANAAEEVTEAPAEGHRFVKGDSAHRCTCGKSRNAKIHGGQPAAPRVAQAPTGDQVVVRNLEIGARTNVKGVGAVTVTDKVKIEKAKFLVTFTAEDGARHERELWASSRFRLVG